MSLSNRDWIIIIAGLAGGEAGRKVLKGHHKLGKLAGTLAASYGADKLFEKLSDSEYISAEKYKEALTSYRNSPKFKDADKSTQGFINELTADETPPEIIKALATEEMPHWFQIAMAADKAKSVEQSMGEMRGLVYFINRVNRLSSTKTYIEFWNDWKTRNLESRKAIILNSIKNNTDEGMVLAIENIGYDKIEEMLSEQAGIKNIVEPELRIYENSFACLKFQKSPETEGFYEIHRVLVGNIEYRL